MNYPRRLRIQSKATALSIALVLVAIVAGREPLGAHPHFGERWLKDFQPAEGSSGKAGIPADTSVRTTQVVLLGSGTPYPDPARSGPAVAVVVNGAAYLVDCGPGVVRRAAAAERKGIVALKVTNLKTVFITHLHSDHTLGYPDLIFSPWVLGRKDPLQAYGPRGLESMTEHIEKAWEKDVDVRTNGLEHGNTTGYRVQVHEIE